MAIGSFTMFDCRSTATAGNVNGGGFNYGNANFPTDYTATSATGNAPVLSSASYNFVAGDVGAWIYVQSGTNWTPGFYQITAVAANAATVNAAVGAAVTKVGLVQFQVSTVAGCATVASPSGGVCGIDYSQADAARINDTDLACADGDAASPTCTSAAKPFGVNHVGNLMKITAGTGYTVSWYEVVSVSGVTATMDRAVGTDGAKASGTFYLGGAISLQAASDQTFFNRGVAGNTVWVKNTGTYTLGAAITTTVSGTQSAPFTIRGYNSIRGDNPRLKTTQPKIVGPVYFGSTFQIVRNLYLSCATSGNNGIDGGGIMMHNTIINSYASAATACYCSSHSSFIGNEIVCYAGQALVPNTGSVLLAYNYIHHSVNGVSTSASSNLSIIGNIFESISGTCISWSSSTQLPHVIMGNTFYGAASKMGTGINYASATSMHQLITNNIFSGLTSAISYAGLTRYCTIDYNTFYNNTTDVTNCNKGCNDVATNPSFTSVSEYTGTTATTAAGVLTDSGANFANVVAGRDYLYLVSGTGITTGFYGITAKTATTITPDNAPGNDATGDKVYKIIYGHDYTPGSALKAAALPHHMNALSVSYLDIGAVQRQEFTSTDPGVANVKSGTAYTLNDASLTGTLATSSGSSPGFGTFG